MGAEVLTLPCYALSVRGMAMLDGVVWPVIDWSDARMGCGGSESAQRDEEEYGLDSANSRLWYRRGQPMRN